MGVFSCLSGLAAQRKLSLALHQHAILTLCSVLAQRVIGQIIGDTVEFILVNTLILIDIV